MNRFKDKAYINGELLQPESLMMSYGYDPRLSEGAVKCPIFQTSTFVFRSAEEGKAFFEIAYGIRDRRPSEVPGLIYSRLNNPDLEILEDRLTLWDRAEACVVFNSGMAAITTTILTFCRPGQVVLHSEPLYGGTDHMLKSVLKQFDIEAVSFPAGADRETIRAAVEIAGGDRLAMIFCETPSNPTNRLVDLAALAEIRDEYTRPGREVVLAVDNTFLGPVWQRPIEHGADLVIYSATKYIGGHSDLVAGVCQGRSALVERIKAMRTFTGSQTSPWTGWLLLRSLETLKLRMTCQMKNARYLADFLADHPKVESVYYLGLIMESDPQYAIYRRQCLGPGAMISFNIVGGEKEAFRFLDELKLFKLAVSLGGTESLAEHPSTMTHADVSAEAKEKTGISDKMVRLSIGVEHPEDLIRDLKQALAAV